MFAYLESVSMLVVVPVQVKGQLLYKQTKKRPSMSSNTCFYVAASKIKMLSLIYVNNLNHGCFSSINSCGIG